MKQLITLCALLAGIISLAAADLKTRNVFLISTDGLRWQEVFSGAEEALLDKANGGVANPAATRRTVREAAATASIFAMVWGAHAPRVSVAAPSRQPFGGMDDWLMLTLTLNSMRARQCRPRGRGRLHPRRVRSPFQTAATGTRRRRWQQSNASDFKDNQLSAAHPRKVRETVRH